jgi:hypothetical protein
MPNALRLPAEMASAGRASGTGAIMPNDLSLVIKLKREEGWEKSLVIITLCGLFAWGCYQFAVKDTTPKMTKEELRPLLGDPNVVIIDVRLDDEWKKSESKIKGAVREDPEKAIKGWADKYPKDKTLVFY